MWLVRVGEGLARVVEGLVTAVEGLAVGLGVAVEKGLAAPVENLAVGIAVGFEGLALGLAVFENFETTEELVVAVDGAGSIDAGLVVAVDSGLVVGLLGPVDSGLVVGLLGPVDSGLVVGLLGVLGEGAGETRGGRGNFGRGACLGSGGIRVPLNGFGGSWGRFREVDTEVTVAVCGGFPGGGFPGGNKGGINTGGHPANNSRCGGNGRGREGGGGGGKGTPGGIGGGL